MEPSVSPKVGLDNNRLCSTSTTLSHESGGQIELTNYLTNYLTKLESLKVISYFYVGICQSKYK